LDPKKALMKGLKSISREEFVGALRLFAKGEGGNYEDFDEDKQLRQKYPVYDEAFQMVLRAAQTAQKAHLLHASGMLSAFRILAHIAEGQ